MQLVMADHGPLTFLTLQRLVPVIEQIPHTRPTPEAPIGSGIIVASLSIPSIMTDHDTSQKV
jgi:hypothetical protein